MTQMQMSDESGLSRATLQNLERGGKLRRVNLAKIEAALGWAPGSGQAILEGAPSPTEASSSPVAVTEDELTHAVTSAIVATVDTMTAAEIREVSRKIVEDLKAQGVL